jgi:hypothetical protein
MAINEAQYVAKVRALALQMGKTLELSDIWETLDNALMDLSGEIKDSSDYPLGQKEYTLSLVSGVASLAAIPDIYIGEIETVLHPDIDGSGTSAYLSKLNGGTRADLAQSRNTIFYPYVIEKNSLYASLGQGTWPSAEDVPPDSVAVIAVAPFVFAIGTVPRMYEDRLIELGVQLAMGQSSGPI